MKPVPVSNHRSLASLSARALAALLFAAGPLAAADDWTAAREEDGIRVFTRLEEGKPIQSYRVEAEIDAPVDRLKAILLDANRAAEWSRDVSESRRIGKPEDQVGYARTDLPFPVWDRDMVQRAIVREGENGVITIEMKAEPDLVPEVDSVVRIRDTWATFRLEPLDGGRTKLTQHGYADPGGSVPSFVINLFVVDGPLRAVQDLRRAATATH